LENATDADAATITRTASDGMPLLPFGSRKVRASNGKAGAQAGFSRVTPKT